MPSPLPDQGLRTMWHARVYVICMDDASFRFLGSPIQTRHRSADMVAMVIDDELAPARLQGASRREAQSQGHRSRRDYAHAANLSPNSAHSRRAVRRCSKIPVPTTLIASATVFR